MIRASVVTRAAGAHSRLDQFVRAGDQFVRVYCSLTTQQDVVRLINSDTKVDKSVKVWKALINFFSRRYV